MRSNLALRAGLFWAVDGGEIVATGLENVYARGAESAGAFAASVAVARAESLWARGEVVGAEGAVGGLFGIAEGGDIVDSWFAGEVYGAADAGGLIGVARAASAANVWTAAQVAGRGDVGGAFGRADSVTVRGAFAAGAVGGARGARAGGFVGSAQDGVFDRAYFDIDSTDKRRRRRPSALRVCKRSARAIFRRDGMSATTTNIRFWRRNARIGKSPLCGAA